tara:strand:- start:512 stop:1720 length:1209 start_codon:yes stop_codon:yes gene_type:complete
MKILFAHTNFPAQFRRLLPALEEAGHEIVFLCAQKEWHAPDARGIRLFPFRMHRESKPEFIHPYLRRLDEVVLAGQAAFRAACSLKEEGWIPDRIVSHIGFGSGLYLSDCFPKAKRIGCLEWFYRAYGSDVDFLGHGLVEDDRKMRLRTWNAQLLLEAEACQTLVTPTRWQWNQFPKEMQLRMQIVHEGIDWDTLSQLRKKSFKSLDQLPKQSDIEWVTYISRGFEEYRGFPQAMKAIAMLQERRPLVHVAIAGADIVAYGAPRKDGRTWKQWAQQELNLDPHRTHWLGPIQENEYQVLLAMTNAHLYLTIPFVLSWSLLEAMAAGCPIVSSTTPPVEEVLENGKNSYLVDFWDPIAQADALEACLLNPENSLNMGLRASHAAMPYAFKESLKAWKSILFND